MSMQSNSNNHFDHVLDECLERVAGGESIESCLDSYPDDANRLGALLRLSTDIKGLPVPVARKEAVEAGRMKMLANLRPVPERQTVSVQEFLRYSGRMISMFMGRERMQMKPVMRLIVGVLMVCIVGSTLAVNVSASSLPGDPLYGVKRTWEDVRLAFSLNDASRQALEEQLKSERVEEMEELIQAHREGIISYIGEIKAIRPHQWLIDDIWVKIADHLNDDVLPLIGDVVEVTIEVDEDGNVLVLEVTILETIPPLDEFPEPPDMEFPEVPEDAEWVTPIPYWETYQPTEWRTLVPTEYYTLIPTDLLETVVPTQYQTYIPEDLGEIPTLINTLIPTWHPTLPPLDPTTWPTDAPPPTWPTEVPPPPEEPPAEWPTLPPAVETLIPPEWPTVDPDDYTTEVPEFIETVILPPGWGGD